MLCHRVRAHYEQLLKFEGSHIIGLKEADWSNRRIARHRDRSDAAIRRCWQEWVNKDRFQRHDSSRRHSATADREDRLIVKTAVIALDSSLSTIRCVTCTRVSTTTIHRRLIERSLPSYGPLRHLPLTPAHRRARLQWCFALSSWNQTNWGRIVFSDESRFQLCPDDNRRRVWRRPR
ncbi:HTH_Tnp_Tc3_2 domain-containing protein [Trichonephila clavipes]|nr:HTH_Tnp_Tc3_2 domain-containing protein [Trichonephila clavipes]